MSGRAVVRRQVRHHRRRVGVGAHGPGRVEDLDVLVVPHDGRRARVAARVAAGLVPAADDQHLAVGQRGERRVPAAVGHVLVAGPGLGPRVEGHDPLRALEAGAVAQRARRGVLEVAADHQHAAVRQQGLPAAPDVGRHRDGPAVAALVGHDRRGDGLRLARGRVPDVGRAAVPGLGLGRVLGLREVEHLAGRHQDAVDRGAGDLLERAPEAVARLAQGRRGRGGRARLGGRDLARGRAVLRAGLGVGRDLGRVLAGRRLGARGALGGGRRGPVGQVVVEDAGLGLVEEGADGLRVHPAPGAGQQGRQGERGRAGRRDGRQAQQPPPTATPPLAHPVLPQIALRAWGRLRVVGRPT